MRKLLIFFLFFSFLFADVSKFIKHNSYVIDPYNNNRVTSESQGYGLLYAYLSDNKKLFDSMWKWTKTHMQRKDALFAWNYNNGKVVDYNNATDGDLFIAYSLLRASYKWHNKEYYKESRRIIKELKKYILEINNNMILLPGKYGFVKGNGIEVFPSYYIKFIFDRFYDETNDITWKYISAYTEVLYNQRLSDRMLFSFFDKDFTNSSGVSMDVYRVILYQYLSNENINILKNSFKEIDTFFIRHGYIPLVYKFSSKTQTKTESPYCVYGLFYMLYNNKAYLKKYIDLKKIDKKNYFCSFLDFFLQKGIK